MTEYRVQLPVFSGPLDLLLHLVREREVEIQEIPVARIADQYLEYAKAMAAADLDQTGEFLVLASTLMEIKSRELLPDPTPEEQEELQELRTQLIEQLLEYRRYREAARTLAGLAERQSKLFGRSVDSGDLPQEMPRDPRQGLQDLEVWDLVRAFARVLRQIGDGATLRVAAQEIPVVMHMERVMERLQASPGEGLPFIELGEGSKDRGFWIGTFLALLELIRLLKIRVSFDAAGALRIHPREGAPDRSPAPQEGGSP